MANVFIVMENSFEYDDERYHSPECGGGKPLQAFTSEAKAEAFATKKNIEELRDLLAGKSYRGLGSMGYDPDEVFTDPDKAAEILGVDVDDLMEFETSEKLSDEQLSQLNDVLNLVFYEVMEVEKG